jgi:hypothetical protein
VTKASAMVVAVAMCAACGPGRRAAGPAAAGAPRPDAEPKLPIGEHQKYVVDSATLPVTEDDAQALGLDLDGDGDVDNKLAVVTQLLASGGADVNFNLAQQIAFGDVMHLADLQATSLVDATASAIYVWMGANPSPTPCLGPGDTVCGRHLTGTAHFDVANTDPVAAMTFGRVSGGHYSGDRGKLTLEIPIIATAAPLTLEIIEARIEVDVAPGALTNGRIAGAITAEFIHDHLLPQLQDAFAVEIVVDCTGVSPNCCFDDTNGKQLIDLFDADGSCTVSLQELRDSSVLGSVLAPDVDLLDSEGFPGQDQVLESLSLGLGFTAVPAFYDLPPGLP